REIRPVTLGEPEEPARLVHLVVLVRVEPRLGFGEVCGWPWISRIRNIDHHDAGARLLRVVFRCHVGAAAEVRRPVLRKGPFTLELPNQLEIAVVAALGVGMAVDDSALRRRGLALQPAFRMVRTPAYGLRHRTHRSDLIGPSTLVVALASRIDRAAE